MLHPQQEALLLQAVQALSRRDPHQALALLDQADQLGQTHDSLLNRALAFRLLGRFNDAIVALDNALDIKPYDFTALLAKGAMLEKLNQTKAAVETYRNALKISPPIAQCPPALAAQMEYASRLIDSHAKALADHMRARLASMRDGLDAETLDRFEEGLDIYAGVRAPPKQEPLLLHYPRLPTICFYDRKHFPWLDRLEEATPVIQAELNQLLAAEQDDFAPYIAYPKGAPVNQWAELNHSTKWSSLFLWKDGQRQEKVCEQCPQTAALLDSLPMAQQDGFAPTAMFSALQPHVHIPAHTGSSNIRLLCHLPLILPGPARFRVGNHIKHWEMGKAWVFDDTIEHEAWNDADSMRVILIFDIWNPYLDEKERHLITEMMKAHRDYVPA